LIVQSIIIAACGALPSLKDSILSAKEGVQRVIPVGYFCVSFTAKRVATAASLRILWRGIRKATLLVNISGNRPLCASSAINGKGFKDIGQRRTGIKGYTLTIRCDTYTGHELANDPF
jgi:hypothetical protein